MLDLIKEELAPTGVLRVGVNMSNRLLVTGEDADGAPTGVSPDLGAEIARRLGVSVKLVPYPNPAAVSAAAVRDEWDIANIGAEPRRAETIAFTQAYCEIEATYLVPETSSFQSVDDVDSDGVRIAVKKGAAYGLWLERNIVKASLDLIAPSEDTALVYRDGGHDALAGLRTVLTKDLERLPGSRLLPGRFMSVQQAVGTPRKNTHAAPWLNQLVVEVIKSGLVAELIARHNVVGLSVAQVEEA